MAAGPSVAVSLKARGLSVFERRPGQLAAFGRQGARELGDVSVAIAADVLLLSPSAWFSVLLTILTTAFYASYHSGALARPTGAIMVPVALLIHLPTLWLAYLVRCSSA